MLELRHVDLALGGRPILTDVGFSVGEQETLAVLGASGSGKSTILKVILGLLRPDRGQVLVRGRDLAQVSYRELVAMRRRMGIVFQEGALFDSLTVGENVGYYFMEHEGLSHAQVEARVLEMLETVGLRHTVDMMPDELSGGMRRRVAIARALLYRPDLILYDEPTTGLDPVAAGSILELINRLKREHRVTSVVVTHDLDDAAEVADRMGVVQAGRLAWSGSRRQFLAQRARLLKDYYSAAPERTLPEVRS
jgi:phospholipid/cholesterol/gamma-HCH transport system ATP-binding protein